MNPTQPALVQGAIAKIPPNSEIIIAMDADPSGRMLAEQITKLFHATGRDDLTLTNAEPPAEGEDWNDQLRAKNIVSNSGTCFHGTVPTKKFARRG